MSTTVDRPIFLHKPGLPAWLSQGSPPFHFTPLATDEHNLDIGRHALAEEINANPEASAHAQQMYDAINAARK
jgi:hypothetical protein